MISSAVRSNELQSRLETRRSWLLLLGMTAIPCWVAHRKRACAGAEVTRSTINIRHAIEAVHTFLMSLGNLDDGVLLHETFRVRHINAKLDIALRPKRRIRSQCDPVSSSKLHEGFLSQVRVQLDLDDLRFVFRIAKDVQNLRATDVAA